MVLRSAEAGLAVDRQLVEQAAGSGGKRRLRIVFDRIVKVKRVGYSDSDGIVAG